MYLFIGHASSDEHEHGLLGGQALHNIVVVVVLVVVVVVVVVPPGIVVVVDDVVVVVVVVVVVGVVTIVPFQLRFISAFRILTPRGTLR